MAGVILQRNQVGMRETGTTVTIPNNPKAKLMYYLDCVCSVLPSLDDDGDFRRLRHYNNHANLTDDEYAKLLAICLLIEPRVLQGQVFFLAPELCGDSNNKFFELSQVSTQFAATDSILIGGVRRRVQKIMVYNERWLMTYFLEPFKNFCEEMERMKQQQQRAITYSSQSSSDDSCCCTIL